MLREYGRLLQRTLLVALCAVYAVGFRAQAQDADGPSKAEIEQVCADIEKVVQMLKRLSDKERRALGDALFPRRRAGKLPESTRKQMERQALEAVRKHKARRDLKRRLHALDPEEFASARAVVVQNCLSWLLMEEGRPEDARTTRKCIRILGQIRAAEAALILVEKIDLRLDKDEPASETNVREKYPACDALVKIGKPSVHAAVEALKEAAPESEKAGLYVLVILGVEGADVGRFILQGAADAATDPRKRANLRAAIKRLEGRDPGTKAIPKHSVP